MKKVLSLLLVATMLVCSVALMSCNNNKDAKTFTYLYNTSDAHKAIGEYVQTAFKQGGFNMKLENQEWNTFLETRKSGDYTVARNGWLADFNDPISFLDMWTTASGNNDVQYGKGAHKDLKMYSIDLTPYGGSKVENGTWAETYDVLISMIKACTNDADRFAMMHLAEDMLMDTGCIVPLYFYTDLYMLSKDVNGFYANPLGYKYFMYTTNAGQTDNLPVCIASEPATIDPALNSAVDGATLVSHLFSGLAKWAMDENGALTIQADAAKELVKGTVGADGKVTYVYTLRDGMKWSDGQPVKASDFEYAWNRSASAALGADYGYMLEIIDGYAGVADGVEGAKLNVTADDAANTLTVVLANAISYWDELLAFPSYYPVRKDVVENADGTQNDAWATKAASYVCNGPYTIKEDWAGSSKLTLVKNDNFVDADKVTMKQIEFFFSDDATAMLTNFKSGTWKLIDDIPTDEIETLKKDYKDEFFISGQIGTYYVCFNINESLVPASMAKDMDAVALEKANMEIRKALALLIDRNHVCEDIAQGGQVPASSFVAMGMTDADGKTEFYKNTGFSKDFDGYYDTSKEAYEGNVNKALEILGKYYTVK